MSCGYSCKCPESKKPLAQRRWGCIQYKCNFSAFSGYQYTPSDYSAVVCLECRTVWRTKAAFVDSLEMVKATSSGYEFESVSLGAGPEQKTSIAAPGSANSESK